MLILEIQSGSILITEQIHFDLIVDTQTFLLYIIALTRKQWVSFSLYFNFLSYH